MEISRSAVAADPLVVRHDHQRLPGRVQLLEHAQDVERGGAVQVAGRLVGQDQQRLVGQRPGDGDPLALARRTAPRADGRPGRSIPTCSSRSRARRRAARGGTPGQQRRQFHVLLCGEFLHQVERLEHEAHFPPPHLGERALAQLLDPPAVDPQLTTGGRSRPPSRCSSVDFPQPLGPITATVSPRAMSRSTPSTARTRPSPRPYSLAQSPRPDQAFSVIDFPFR